MNDLLKPMSGRRTVITGATSGHGRALATALTSMGADCLMIGRNRAKCEETVSLIRDKTGRAPGFVLCDLSSLRDIERAAREILADSRPIHILINNAGLVSQRYSETVDGNEETFAVNYLSMYALTIMLKPRIVESAPARIINVSSDTHRIGALDLDDIQGRNRRYTFMGAYSRSKLAVVHFTVELARLLEGTGVTVNAVDPGPIASGIADKPGVIPAIANAVIRLTFPSPEKACRTALHLAVSEEVAGTTGGYFRFMKMKPPKTVQKPGDFGMRLMHLSAKMTGAPWG
ncbi:MAG TPA: SDR family NAD(P)-dependent oxidoreductase [Spirochaetota bacterium]|nr:SDR family NAD(P)-dependent oxidoreductase [Spirochaetota bacterium]HRZ27593.1 SDR family NAD(P)-dependent oxidoreductase [Spirochaetota bacterium]HSA13854.1 SDR family NAD(P)-dependent oxidoreductase [Spirochaetota bacterium]